MFSLFAKILTKAQKKRSRPQRVKHSILSCICNVPSGHKPGLLWSPKGGPILIIRFSLDFIYLNEDHNKTT